MIRRETLYIGLVWAIALAGPGCQPAAIDAYHISGTIDSLSSDQEMVILQQFDPISQARTPIDTALVSADGKYEVVYHPKHADLYQLSFPGRQRVTIVVDEGQYDIQLNVEGKRNGKVEISGSKDAELLLAYEDFRLKSYNRLVRPPYLAMTQASKADDREAEIMAVEEYVHHSKLHRKELLDFTEEQIGTSIALYGTVLRWTGDEEIRRLEKLVSDFAVAHPGSAMADVMSDKVTRYSKVALGAMIPKLSDKNPVGETISFAEVKGKYTLIDFWASWCRPCILQIPDLKAAHEAYRDEGFEILGVSLDTEASKWAEAIEKYALDWPHLSDVLGWQSQHAANFNVTFVPYNLLVDQDGRIVAKNLHSIALVKKLEELFGQES